MVKNVTSTSDLTKRTFFTKTDNLLDVPNLVDHQNRSFQWFVEEGLGEIFAEINIVYTDRSSASARTPDAHRDR